MQFEWIGMTTASFAKGLWSQSVLSRCGTAADLWDNPFFMRVRGLSGRAPEAIFCYLAHSMWPDTVFANRAATGRLVPSREDSAYLT